MKPTTIKPESPTEATLKVMPGSYTLDHYKKLRITKESKILQPDPTITIDGAAVASPGNITAISAGPKAGKTALAAILIAKAITKDGEIKEFNKIKVLPNKDCKAVLHFDTEQSDADQQYLVNSILQRAKFAKTPDHYQSYNFRRLIINDYKEKTENICKLAYMKFGGIYLILVDGIADYIKNVNDEEQADDIVRFYTKLAMEYNCPVIVLVHLNPGTDKERGHLGSIIQRRCYALMSITKRKGISAVQLKLLRKAGNSETPSIYFAYNETKGFHEEVLNMKHISTVNKDNRIKELAEVIFQKQNAYKYTIAVEKIMGYTKRKQSSAKAMIGQMIKNKFIIIGKDKLYKLAR